MRSLDRVDLGINLFLCFLIVLVIALCCGCGATNPLTKLAEPIAQISKPQPVIIADPSRSAIDASQEKIDQLTGALAQEKAKKASAEKEANRVAEELRMAPIRHLVLVIEAACVLGFLASVALLALSFTWLPGARSPAISLGICFAAVFAACQATSIAINHPYISAGIVAFLGAAFAAFVIMHVRKQAITADEIARTGSQAFAALRSVSRDDLVDSVKSSAAIRQDAKNIRNSVAHVLTRAKRVA